MGAITKGGLPRGHRVGRVRQEGWESKPSKFERIKGRSLQHFKD